MKRCHCAVILSLLLGGTSCAGTTLAQVRMEPVPSCTGTSCAQLVPSSGSQLIQVQPVPPGQTCTVNCVQLRVETWDQKKHSTKLVGASLIGVTGGLALGGLPGGAVGMLAGMLIAVLAPD